VKLGSSVVPTRTMNNDIRRVMTMGKESLL